MDNFSDIVLSKEKVSLRKRIRSLRINMDALKNKESDYYEHHQHLINTFEEISNVVDAAIMEAELIGTGV